MWHLVAGVQSFCLQAASRIRLCCSCKTSQDGIAHDLAGKTAVITGSNSGIGLGIAGSWRGPGANVVLNSFTDTEDDHALAERIAKEIGVKARYIQADMSKGAECRPLIEKAGACDILVNNAGIQHVAPIDRVPGRQMGRDHRDQPQFGLSHHGGRAADDAQGGLGQGDQHRHRRTG